MIDNLIVSVKAVFPLFAIMAIGWFIKRRGLVDDQTLKKMNAVCFKVFMAFMMFNNVYSMDMSRAMRPKLMLYAIVSLLLVTSISLFLVIVFEKDNRRRGVLAQAMLRGNFVVLGLPMVESLYGAAALDVPTMLVSFVVPYYNIVCVIILTYFSGNDRPGFLYFVKEVLTNPYIVAAALGFLCLGLHITLPEMVESTIHSLAQAANPLALIILGAGFTFGNVKKYRKELISSCSLRLVLFPGLVLGIGILLGFREVELMTLLTIFATPTAIASHAMAQHLGGDADLAGVNVVICTAVSILTLFLWVFALKSFGFL